MVKFNIQFWIIIIMQYSPIQFSYYCNIALVSSRLYFVAPTNNGKWKLEFDFDFDFVLDDDRKDKT